MRILNTALLDISYTPLLISYVPLLYVQLSCLDLMGGVCVSTIIQSIVMVLFPYYRWPLPSLALACLSNASTIIPAILSDTVALTAA